MDVTPVFGAPLGDSQPQSCHSDAHFLVTNLKPCHGNTSGLPAFPSRSSNSAVDSSDGQLVVSPPNCDRPPSCYIRPRHSTGSDVAFCLRITQWRDFHTHLCPASLQISLVPENTRPFFQEEVRALVPCRRRWNTGWYVTPIRGRPGELAGLLTPCRGDHDANDDGDEDQQAQCAPDEKDQLGENGDFHERPPSQ